MSLSGSLPAWMSRRVLLALGVAAVAACSSASVLHAQTPPAQTPPAAQPAPAAPDVFAPKSSPAILLNIIKADKAADFEDAMKQIKGLLAASTDEKRKQQAEGWQVYKMLESIKPATNPPDPNAQVIYVWLMSPGIVGQSYDPGKIIYEGIKDKAAADALFKKLSESYAQVQQWTLEKVVDMKGGGL